MILHLFIDDKFSDYVVQQFAAEEMQSDFVLISSSQKMQYFKYVDAVHMINPYVSSEMEKLLLDISNRYKAVVFHGLFHPWQEWLLCRWPSHVKIAWSCWGGEVYGQPDVRTSFLKPFTKCVDWWHRIGKSYKHTDVFPKELLKKADFCLTGIEAEYEYSKRYLGTNLRYLQYSYYSIDDTLGTLRDSCIKGENIFVGNAATIENNHLETFLQLKIVGINNKKIIVPLSYGAPWVRNMCLRVGKCLFGKQFNPLLNFMPLEQYNTTMLDCSVMIQPHLRENAHGNIVTGLWLGMRVYLSERGIDYQRFKRIGVHVYSIEKDLRKNNPKVFQPLTAEEIAYNRKLLLQHYGRENMQHLLCKIVQTLNQ